MSTFDLEANIRVIVPTSVFATDTRDRLLECGASPSKDLATWSIDVISEVDVSSLDVALEKSLDLVSRLRANSWWARAWPVAIWLTASTGREFVGVALSHATCRSAGDLDVDIILSVYCSQAPD
jgi:hypothetical protein